LRDQLTPSRKKLTKAMASKQASIPAQPPQQDNEFKPGDYQIQVHIIEGENFL
jgi:hypothetical protein